MRTESTVVFSVGINTDLAMSNSAKATSVSNARRSSSKAATAPELPEVPLMAEPGAPVPAQAPAEAEPKVTSETYKVTSVKADIVTMFNRNNKPVYNDDGEKIERRLVTLTLDKSYKATRRVDDKFVVGSKNEITLASIVLEEMISDGNFDFNMNAVDYRELTGEKVLPMSVVATALRDAEIIIEVTRRDAGDEYIVSDEVRKVQNTHYRANIIDITLNDDAAYKASARLQRQMQLKLAK